MAQPLVLAIEPDLRQAAIVKRIVREKGLAEVAVVDSRDAAIEAMRTCMPDVLLLSALMSPRDEDDLIAHLKTLDNAGHLQTHTIPQLASALGPDEGRPSRGLLSAFRRKKEPAPVAGCDPDLFAEEIRVFLERAAEKKRQRQNTNFTAPDMRPSAVVTTRAAAAEPDEPDAAPSSSWSSPFEWKPSGSSARATRPTGDAPPPANEAAPATELPISGFAQGVTAPPEEPPPLYAVAEPVDPVSAAPESVIVQPPETAPAPSIEPAAPVVVEAVHAGPPPSEPIVHAVARPVTAPDPIATSEEPAAPVVVEAVHAAPPASDPIVHAVTDPVTSPGPIAAAKRAAAKAPAPEPARPKPVADRPTKIAARGQLKGLVKWPIAKGHQDTERLGPMARWARSEPPRAAKTDPVTADDVRALISSLAVPSAVASVTYPRGCRIRRVRVPVSPDHDGGAGTGPVILSGRSAGDQRDKHPSA